MTICLSSQIVNASGELSAALHRAARGYGVRPENEHHRDRSEFGLLFFATHWIMSCWLINYV
jgi:hypothetical protein